MNTYTYVTTQRPVAPGTYPNRRGEPVEFENFDERKIYHDLNAWGWLKYDYPLTDEEMDDYELIAIDSEAQAEGIRTFKQFDMASLHTDCKVIRGDGFGPNHARKHLVSKYVTGGNKLISRDEFETVLGEVFAGQTVPTPSPEPRMSPYERTRAQVYATGNKWAKENFDATH